MTKRLRRNDSQWTRAALAVRGESTFGQRIEFSGRGIAVDTGIPIGGIEGGKPRAETRQLLVAKCLDLPLDFFKLGHDRNLAVVA